MVALFAARLESPTRRLIVSVSFIALGTALASVGEVNLSTAGILIMFLSEAFEAIRLVMTQVLLVGLKFHPIEGLLYLAPACTFWLLLGSACLEFPRMAQNGAFLLMLQRPVKFTVAAAMGFMVNSLAYIVIQTASSLTLKVRATAGRGRWDMGRGLAALRNWCQVVGGRDAERSVMLGWLQRRGVVTVAGALLPVGSLMLGGCPGMLAAALARVFGVLVC